MAEGFPEIGGKNFARYLVFFPPGFIAVANEPFMESAERRRALALVVALAGIAVTMVVYATFPALMLAATVLSRAGYEVVRRVRPLRFLFGMRPLPRTSRPPAADAAA